MKKRVLSLLMALVLCFSMLPTAALAEDAGAVQEIQDAANTGDIDNSGDVGGTDEGEDSGDVDAPVGEDGEDTRDNGDTEAQDDMAQDTGDGKTPDAGVPDSEVDTAVLTAQIALPAEGETHTAHCVCGKDSTTVNGHAHDATTTWTAADSLPESAGSYYLTQPVTSDWTVPTGEVKLCLNGQTITGSITVGSGAKLTLTDCTDSGTVQGGVLVNGGTLELYGGTITGGVQVGKHNDTASGSKFTMFGGVISGHDASSGSGGGVFLVGTTNSNITPPSFTMHGGTISGNTAGASDGGGGGVYVGEKCSFTMDGGTITGNTATGGNGGGIYIHMLSKVTISGGEITNNTATGSDVINYGGGIYSETGVTVSNATITKNTADEGCGIYGKGTIALTDAIVTDNSNYDIYYGGQESTTPKLTVSGSVKVGYYANYAWKLPIRVSGALDGDSVIRVGVYDGIKPSYGETLTIAEPADNVTLNADNFERDVGDCVTSLGEGGKVYLARCAHEMDESGYTCKKCHTEFDARVDESDYYQTLKEAFSETEGGTVTLLRDVTLNEKCSAAFSSDRTLDLNGKTISSEDKPISVNKKLTIKNSGTNGGAQALNVKFFVYSNGTLAVDDSYTGDISCVELQAGGALKRFGGKIGELVLSNAASGYTGTGGYDLKLWNGNANACTIGKLTDNTTNKTLAVNDLLGTDYAKCELCGEKDGTWSVINKGTKLSELPDYTAYKVQYTECEHKCSDDSDPVCSVCGKALYTKITAKAADGTVETAYFAKDSTLENGYVEAINALNHWGTTGYTEPALTLLRDMPYGTSMTLTGTLTLAGGAHTARNVTVDENANVTFASGDYTYSSTTINGTATVKADATFGSVTVNGTLNVKGGAFTGVVTFENGSTANISGGSFTNKKESGGVTFGSSVTGTISDGTFTYAEFYTTGVKLTGGKFEEISISGGDKLADLLAEGAAYYTGNNAVSDDAVKGLTNVTVKSHTHEVDDTSGVCSICNKQMTAAVTVDGTKSWYVAFASAIEAANAADGEKTITLYQDVDGYASGSSTTYELTRGPVTLDTGTNTVKNAKLIAKGISLTVTGTGTLDIVKASGSGAVVENSTANIDYITAEDGGRLELSGGSYKSLSVKDGSSGSLSGGSYGTINGDSGNVKPYALLAKGYGYKKIEDSTWVSNANKTLSNVTVEKAHEHPICGDESCTKTEHQLPEGMQWTPTATLSDNMAEGYYYLTQDIELTTGTWVPVDGMVLDLNGKSITAKGAFDTITVNSGVHFTLTDCKGGGENYGAITHFKDPSNNTKPRVNGRGVMVSAGGEFTMYGGCIGPNLISSQDTPGAGVYVAEGATFTMLGGEIAGNVVSSAVRNNGGGIWTAGTTTIGGNAKITGNRAQAGGGVYVNGGTLTLAGSTIVTDNSAYNTHGSGIFVGTNGQLCVSGSVQVTENTYNDTIAGNVYLEPDSDKRIKNPIRVVDELTDASIHVSFFNETLNAIGDSNPMTIAQASTAGWIQDGSFVLDGQSTHKLYMSEDGKAVELGTHQHEWEYSKQETDNSIRATCRVCQQYCCVSLPDGSYVYDGNAKGPVADYTGTWTADEVNVVYRQGNTVLPGRPTAVGQYTASITLTGKDGTSATITIAFEIRRGLLDKSDFELKLPDNAVYDGKTNWTVTIKKMPALEDGDTAAPMYYNIIGADPNNPSYAYAWGNTKNAGTYAVKIEVNAANYVNSQVPDSLDDYWRFTVETAEYEYSGPEAQEVIVNCGLDAIVVPEGGTGVALADGSRETVTGTLAWYTDSACTIPAPENNSFNGQIGSTVTLYWRFAATDTNYKAEAKTGSTVFTIKDAPTQDLTLANGGQSVSKVYGDAAFTIAATTNADGGKITYSSNNEDVATVDVNGTVTIHGAGNATITATAKEVIGKYKETSVSYTLEVAPKSVSVFGIFAANKDYDGTENTTPYLNHAGIHGKVNENDDVRVIDAAIEYENANVGTPKTAHIRSVTLGGTDAANYVVDYQNSQSTTTGAIYQKQIKLNHIDRVNKVFDGSDSYPVQGEIFDGLQNGETLVRGRDYTISAHFPDANADETNQRVTALVVLLANATTKNYVLSISDGEYWFNDYAMITKADYGDKTAPGSAMYGHSGTVDLSSLIAEGGTAALGTVTDSNNVLNGMPTINDATLHFAFANSTDNRNKTAVVAVNVTGATNYMDYTITVTLTVDNRLIPVPDGDLTFTPAEITYGDALNKITITGKMKDPTTNAEVEGTFLWQQPDTILTAGTHSDAAWKFTPKNTETYAETTGTVTVKVNQATLSGTPGYTKITSSGKTLKDAGLTIGTLNPGEGTLVWVDEDGNVLGSDTKVEANKSYTWRFTPKDTNYGVRNGEIELYHRSGGYYYYPTDTGTGTKPSAGTGDAGLLPYAVTALMSYTGTAALLRRRKRED